MNMVFRHDVPALDFLVARPITHRGYHDRAKGIIENTERAFAAAISAGYAIECDLQLSKDSEAVLFHDDRLERVIEAQGFVKDRTVQELKRLPIRGTADRVQTLAEMLEQVDGRVPLVIELKAHWDGDVTLVKRVIDTLKGYRGAHALMSFDPDMIDAMRVISPHTIRGIVADRAFDSYYDALPLWRRIELRTLSHLGRIQPHFMSVSVDDLPWAPVAAFRAAGQPVICWTVRSPQQAAFAYRHIDQITFEGFSA